MTKFQYLLSAAALSLAPPSGQAAANSVAVDRATEGLAQLLVASENAVAAAEVQVRKTHQRILQLYLGSDSLP